VSASERASGGIMPAKLPLAACFARRAPQFVVGPRAACGGWPPTLLAAARRPCANFYCSLKTSKPGNRNGFRVFFMPRTPLFGATAKFVIFLPPLYICNSIIKNSRKE